MTIYYSKTIAQLAFFFSLFFLSFSSFAQDTAVDEIYVSVKMKDGNTFIGKQLALTDTHIVIETESLGKLNLPRENVRLFKVINKPTISTSGEFWSENPNATRNIVTPTGYGLRKGEGYYQNLMLFYNQFSYGFSDRFALGFGFETVSLLTSGFSENRGMAFTVTPKFSFPIREDSWNIGLGSLLIGYPNGQNIIDLGTLYAVNTFGSRDRNISLGVGFGFVDGEISSRPIVTLSGNLRVSERFAFTTENWILPNSDGALVLSLGGRIIGTNVSWDISILFVSDGDEIVPVPLPLVGLVAPFGRNW